MASARDGDGAPGAPPSEARDDVKPRQAAAADDAAGVPRPVAKAHVLIAVVDGQIAQEQ